MIETRDGPILISRQVGRQVTHKRRLKDEARPASAATDQLGHQLMKCSSYRVFRTQSPRQIENGS